MRIFKAVLLSCVFAVSACRSGNDNVSKVSPPESTTPTPASVPQPPAKKDCKTTKSCSDPLKNLNKAQLGLLYAELEANFNRLEVDDRSPQSEAWLYQALVNSALLERSLRSIMANFSIDLTTAETFAKVYEEYFGSDGNLKNKSEISEQSLLERL